MTLKKDVSWVQTKGRGSSRSAAAKSTSQQRKNQNEQKLHFCIVNCMVTFAEILFPPSVY